MWEAVFPQGTRVAQEPTTPWTCAGQEAANACLGLSNSSHGSCTGLVAIPGLPQLPMALHTHSVPRVFMCRDGLGVLPSLRTAQGPEGAP